MEMCMPVVELDNGLCEEERLHAIKNSCEYLQCFCVCCGAVIESDNSRLLEDLHVNTSILSHQGQDAL